MVFGNQYNSSVQHSMANPEPDGWWIIGYRRKIIGLQGDFNILFEDETSSVLSLSFTPAGCGMIHGIDMSG